MNISIRTFAALAIAIAAFSLAPAAHGQTDADGDDLAFVPRWWIGATIANSENLHTSGPSLLPSDSGDGDDCECGHFGESRRGGRQFGIMSRYEFLPHLALDVRIVSDTRPATYRASLPEALVLLPGSNTVVTQRVTAHSEVEYRLVTTEALLTARLPIAFGISATASAGTSVGIVTDARYSRWHDLDEPANARFSNPREYPTENDGRRIIYNRDSEIPEASAVRLGAKFGGGLEAKLIGLVTLRVGAYYDLGLTNVVADHDWKVNSTLYSAEILIGL